MLLFSKPSHGDERYNRDIIAYKFGDDEGSITYINSRINMRISSDVYYANIITKHRKKNQR
jgi:hypothetical protein